MFDRFILCFLYGLNIGSDLAKSALNLATLEKFAHIALTEFETLNLPKKFTWQLQHMNEVIVYFWQGMSTCMATQPNLT
jgi:hypothetical protein